MAEHRLFEHEPNKPIGFFLHSSIRSFQHHNLASKIRAYGGEVLDSPSGADTVLVDETKVKSIQDVQIRYSMNRDKEIHSVTVEPMKFIHICINTGRFTHIRPDRRGMGGLPAGGRKRTKFTEEDDDEICWYISRRIPDPLDGGRQSLGIYVELEGLADEDPNLAWVKRHPASSWHERYRKNRSRLDPIIQRYVEDFPPNRSALHSYSRRANKKNRLLGLEAKVIEITDDSEDDKESEESFQHKPLKPSKRARIDTDSPSPPQVRASVEAEKHPSYSRDSPYSTLDVFERQNPVPSATLVNKVPQLFKEPASSQAVRSPTLPPHLSTSFRDVLHSSPALHSRLPSNHTSRTEPSSRSLAVLSGLSHPPQNTTNVPAESSILRESTHKRSSNHPLRRAARRPKSSSRQPFPPPSNGMGLESTWAPYKNTRSRSRSVEPIPLQTTRKKSGSKRPTQRNDVPLAPVFEGEIEQERDGEEEEEEEERGVTEQVAESERKNQEVGTTTMTETMQEEHDVEDLLMVQSNKAISGAVSEAWNGVAEVEEQDDDAEETFRSGKHPNRRKPSLFALDSDDDAIDQMMPFPPDRKSVTIEEKGRDKERALTKEEEDREENLVKSEARPYRQLRRRALLNDDDEINRILTGGREMTLDTLQELMASSPEQHLSLNSHLSGSPLQARDQNRRATFPFSSPATLPKQPSKAMRPRPSAGPGLTSLTPSSFGTLLEAPHTPATQKFQPSKARVLSSSKRSQVPSPSKLHQLRRSSLESVNSEVPFPLSGTKASSLKAIMEQHLKESPYTPPSGTKAAALMVTQRQLRSRKQRG